jgi:serine/threonine protein kinase
MSADLASRPATPTNPGEKRLLAEQVQLVLRRSGATGWVEHDTGFWFAVEPPGHLPRAQGWKLHLSATPVSAASVTRRAAEILVAARCAFKVALGLPQVHQLLSVTAGRGSSGKVITAYPRDDEQFVELAERLHRATEDLPGPAILSDRPYRAGSVVHYRFGAFTGHTVLTNDGSYESMLQAPDGTLEPDRREAWYSPPAWARSPLGLPPEPSAGPVLLADRFVVRQAIRHGNKGGVYVGEDRATGAEVVIKEARPHVAATVNGTDARDSLRHEARLLDQLSGHGLTARPVLLFEQGGHLFLAQEKIGGSTLSDWVDEASDPAYPGNPGGISLETVRPLADQLVALVSVLHGEGLVLRDLSPANLMVTPNGVLKLIDLEFAAVPGESVTIVGTPGFAAPEQLDPPGGSDGGIAPAPDQRADLYSIGALLFLLTCGVDPALAPDGRAARTLQQRLTHLVRLVAASHPVTRALGPTIVGLLADDPEQRWTLDRIRDFLAALRDPGAAQAPVLLPASDRLEPHVQVELLADGVAHLVATLQAPTSEHLWTPADTDADNDPRNVQYGAGGVLAVLARSAPHVADPGLRQAIATAATWLERRLSGGDRLLPGLYFGCAGSVWALFDAATLLGDAKLARRALDLALTIPVLSPNPDVCHGTAGAGMAQLHLWAATGDDAFGARVRTCADALVAAATWRDGLVRWQIPREFDSALAGLTHYGFAHGVAGIGAFLLAAARATGEQRYLEVADAAAATLHAVAVREGESAWWPTGEEPDPAVPTRMPHWCSGSSGVGTFLVRHWQATGSEQSRALAEAAAVAVRESRWHMSSASCHGLPGDGEFLLDLADLLGEPRYLDWAAELAACLDARAVLRGWRRVVPDESGHEVSAGYGTGLSGVLSFLLRLRHGGPRPWMVDAGSLAAVTGGALAAEAGR